MKSAERKQHRAEEERIAKALRLSVAYFRKVRRHGGGGDDLCRAYCRLTGGHYNDLMLGMGDRAREPVRWVQRTNQVQRG